MIFHYSLSLKGSVSNDYFQAVDLAFLVIFSLMIVYQVFFDVKIMMMMMMMKVNACLNCVQSLVMHLAA